MKPLLTPLVAAAALTASISAGQAETVIPSASDEFSEYSKVDDWTIYADKTLDTCLAERADDVGDVMQMGVTKDRDYAYVGIFTLADLDVAAEQAIAIAVDGTVFVGESRGLSSGKLKGDYKGGYVLTDNPDMVNAIANGKELVAFPDRPFAFVIDLTGTKAAIAEAKKCLAETGS